MQIYRYIYIYIYLCVRVCACVCVCVCVYVSMQTRSKVSVDPTSTVQHKVDSPFFTILFIVNKCAPRRAAPRCAALQPTSKQTARNMRRAPAQQTCNGQRCGGTPTNAERVGNVGALSRYRALFRVRMRVGARARVSARAHVRACALASDVECL